MLIIVSLIVFAGCSGNSKKEKKEQGDLDGLTNESFKWPAPKGYMAVDDFLDGNVADYDDVLKGESLSKIPKEEINRPSAVDKSIDKAIVACYRGNYTLANNIFDALLKEYRKNPIYWNQVGNCFMMQGSKRKALLYYNKARGLKKDYGPPINNIGVIFERGGFDQKALKSYEESKKVSGFSLTPVFNLAQIYVKYGFIDEGRQLFESMIRINQKDQDALHGLAFVEFVNGDIKKSLALYDRLDRDFYRRPEVGVNLAYALALSGNKSKARDLLGDLGSTSNPSLNEYISKVRELSQ
jgi:tetratricopeptide (TPR) repeat protein